MFTVDNCKDCGFDYGVTTRAEAKRLISGGSKEIGALVAGAGAAAARRSEPDVWSPLEYAGHVRDVLLVQRDRTLLALVEDNPCFVPMYRDQRAVFARYAAEPPASVSIQLDVAATLFLWVFDGLTEEQLARPCVYTYPDPTQRAIEWLLVHTAHEVVHHAADVGRGLGR